MAQRTNITGREAPFGHFWYYLVIAMVAIGAVVLGLFQTTWKSPTLPPVPQFQGGILPTAQPTAVPTLRILAPTRIMLFLGKEMNYGVGGEFSGWTIYPFPIFVSRSFPEVGGDEVFATIPDPKISEIGGKWESAFADPKYPDHLIRVRLVRIASTPWERIESGFYNYEASVSLSWDGGQSWLPNSPPWLTAYIQMQAEAQKGSTPK